MKKFRLDEMTYVEIKEAMSGGVDTVVVPIGAIEQHGPHDPMGVDAFCGLQAAERVAERLGALLAPLMPYGASSTHMSYAGTVTLSGETLIGFTRDVCRSLAAHGFKKIVFVNGNEPNYPSMVIAARQVSEETGVHISISNWFAALMEIWKDLPGVKGTEWEKWRWSYFMAHGGLLETSATMAHKEGIVRMDLATTYPSDRREAVANPVVSTPSRMEAVCSTGSYGDPSGASSELGRKWLDIAADRIVERLRQVWKTLETPP